MLCTYNFRLNILIMSDLLARLLLFSLSLHLLHFNRVHLSPPHEQIMVPDAELQNLTHRKLHHLLLTCFK